MAKRKRKRKRPKGVQPPSARPKGAVCPACGEELPEPEAAVPEKCPRCEAAHHPPCWTAAGGCGACGHRATPPGPGAVLARCVQPLTRPGIAALTLAGLACVLYVYSFFVPFLFDDAPVITRNPLMWQWDELEHWKNVFLDKPMRGLTNVTFLVNFQLAGTPTVVGNYDAWDYVPYHLVNTALHALNGVLLFLLLRGLLTARSVVSERAVPWVALAGAALWIAHPAHTMAVAYISQRYALMAALAFLGTLVLYVRLRLRLRASGDDPLVHALPMAAVLGVSLLMGLAGPIATPVLFVVGVVGVAVFHWLVGAGERLGTWLLLTATVLVSFTCLVTKENATVIALAIPLVEVLFFARRGELRALPLSALFLLTFAAGAAVRLQQVGVLGDLLTGDVGLTGALDRFIPDRSPTADRWQYFTSQVYVVPRYLHLFLLPYDLSAEQNFPALWGSERVAAIKAVLLGKDGASLTGDDLRYLAAIAGHLLLWTLAIKLLARGRRFVPLAILWFYVANLVESSFVPILDPMVDHRMYLPTALLPAAFVVACARAWPSLAEGRPGARVAVPALGAALVVLLGAGTVYRTHAWVSSLRIWRDTVEKRPNCARAYSSLGMEHLYRGEWMEAIGVIEAALHLGPYHVEGWNNLGKAYLELKRWPEAKRALARGIEVHEVAPSPSVPLCWNNLGLVYMQVASKSPGPGEDLARLEAAFDIPEGTSWPLPPAQRRRLLSSATQRLRKAGELKPGYETAWINLSRAEFRLLTLSRGQERARHAENVVRAVRRAQGIAQRRGGRLPWTTYRKHVLALAKAGRPREALDRICPHGQPHPDPDEASCLYVRFPPSERPALAMDAARLALEAQGGGSGGALGVLERAALIVDRTLQAFTDPPGELLLLRGRLADALGDTENAVRFLRRGLAAAPDHPRAPVLEQRLRALEQKTAVPDER